MMNRRTKVLEHSREAKRHTPSREALDHSPLLSVRHPMHAYPKSTAENGKLREPDSSGALEDKPDDRAQIRCRIAGAEDATALEQSKPGGKRKRSTSSRDSDGKTTSSRSAQRLRTDRPAVVQVDGNPSVTSTAEPFLEDAIVLDSSEPFNLRGNFYDLFLGTHATEGKVALKRLRHRGGGDSADEALARDFKREADIWMSFRHEGILRCLGTFTLRGNLCFVTPFMKNGTLFDFVRSEPHLGQQRLRLIQELADALAYVHSRGIIHGDVKAQNILLSDDLHVQLCDFGLKKVAESYTTTRLQGTGSFRWQSPELWSNEPKTLKSDIYAFAMTIVEVLTGEIPFVNLVHDPAVMMAVAVRHEHPARVPLTSPDGTSYSIAWDVAEQCWIEDASKRISMAAAAGLLRSDPLVPSTN